MNLKSILALILILSTQFLGIAFAQEPTAESETTQSEIPKFNWQNGPHLGLLGNHAQISINEMYTFLDADETRRLMSLYGNLPTDIELGLVARSDNPFGWFMVFEFDEIGYVKDNEKEELDAEAILESYKAGSIESNKTREAQGLPAMNITGWKLPPAYDPITNNLEWCLELESEGKPIFNHNIRLLGRKGVMMVTLVCDPEIFDQALAETRILLEGFGYQEGQRYADWVSGDKVAQYGLTALVAGGAMAVAAKSGLLSKLFKPLLFALIAFGAALKKFFRNPFGKKDQTPGS